MLDHYTWQCSYNMGTLILNPKIEIVVEEEPAAETGAPEPVKTESPQTGDMQILAMTAAVLISSALTVIIFKKKAF